MASARERSRVNDITLAWPDTGPFLMQLFVARQQVALELDRCFMGAAPPSGCRVVLYNETDAGLGDVAFATKFARLMSTHLPTVELLIVSTDEAKQRNFQLPEGVRVMSEVAFRALEDGADKRPTLVVSAPGIFDHCRSRTMAYERLGLSEDVPFQYVAEYGSIRQLKDDAFKGMMGALESLGDTFMDAVAEQHGLSPDDMGHSAKSGAVVGVFGEEVRPLDHLLTAYRQPGDDNPMGAWLRQPLLGARSCGLERGELGIHVDARVPLMSPDASALGALEDEAIRGLLLEGCSPSEYAKNTSLYVGYAYEGLALFADYVAVLEVASDRPVDVVMPHRETAAKLAASLFDDASLGRLSKRGVGRIEVVGKGANGATERVEVGLGVGKTMRLITHYPIPNHDFRALHRAAQPATMVSGDQSFSEAVSMGKAVLYLEPVYCQTYHLDAVLELAGRVAPAAREVLNFGMQYRFDEERYPAVQAHLTSSEFYEEFRALNATIHADHDCGPALMALLSRVLWTIRSPAVHDATVQLLERAWSDAEVARGVTLDGAGLSQLRAIAAEGP